eukprot:2912217-Prymnesium_polylepis.1
MDMRWSLHALLMGSAHGSCEFRPHTSHKSHVGCRAWTWTWTWRAVPGLAPLAIKRKHHASRSIHIPPSHCAYNRYVRCGEPQSLELYVYRVSGTACASIASHGGRSASGGGWRRERTRDNVHANPKFRNGKSNVRTR